MSLVGFAEITVGLVMAPHSMVEARVKIMRVYLGEKSGRVFGLVN
jgi:hypothetical protein